jgi:hypothetical protein
MGCRLLAEGKQKVAKGVAMAASLGRPMYIHNTCIFMFFQSFTYTLGLLLRASVRYAGRAVNAALQPRETTAQTPMRTPVLFAVYRLISG